MAAESILTYKKLGFPKTDNSERSYRTVIEYVGPNSTLAAAEPATNATWGDYDGKVTSTTLSPIEGTAQAELTVVCEYFYEAGGEGTGAGTASEIAYEVEWVMFQRPMLEHPQFSPGGSSALSVTDIAAIEKWKNEDDVTKRAAYEYKEKSTDTTYQTLSDAATYYAKGLQLGQESYEDYAPVVRKTTTYLNGLPPTSDVGQKNNPPSFTGGPQGYQWRKSADRAIRAQGQTKWERVEEWTGAKKILSDKNSLYW